MSDIGPYGVTQNADAAAVVADALVGERAGNVTAHQAGAGYGPASFSTAPYVPPKPAPEPEPEPEPEPVLEVAPACRHKGCTQPPVDGFNYCTRHTS